MNSANIIEIKSGKRHVKTTSMWAYGGFIVGILIMTWNIANLLMIKVTKFSWLMGLMSDEAFKTILAAIVGLAALLIIFYVTEVVEDEKKRVKKAEEESQIKVEIDMENKYIQIFSPDAETGEIKKEFVKFDSVSAIKTVGFRDDKNGELIIELTYRHIIKEVCVPFCGDIRGSAEKLLPHMLIK